MLIDAAGLTIPLPRDSQLARRIAEGTANGEVVPDAEFPELANVLLAAGFF